MMLKQYKIYFLTRGQQLLSAEKILRTVNYEDTEVIIADCNVDSLHEQVDLAMSKGCDGFIASSANAAECRRYSNMPLTEIRLYTIDYLIAIQKGLTLGKKMAVAIYRYGRAIDIDLLAKVSGQQPEVIVYEDSVELRSGIMSSDADVIIGGAHANEIAESLGRMCVLLLPNEEAIREAIRRARHSAITLRDRRENRAVINAIINDSPFGIVVSNNEGEIDLFNKTASDQTGLKSSRVRGKKLSEVLPSLGYDKFMRGNQWSVSERHITNGAMLRCTHSRIQCDDGIVGVLTTLHADNARLPKQDPPVPAMIVGHRWDEVFCLAPASAEVKSQAQALSAQEHPLLIYGEEGSGRLYMAECIHTAARGQTPYVPLNLAAISNGDAARILLGDREPGIFELVQNGTLVLENLELATPVMQSILAHALKQSSFSRLGSISRIPLRAHFITVCTSRDQLSGLINSDLWQHLSVLSLEMPPLRRRVEDIIPTFMRYYEQSTDRPRRLRLNAQEAKMLEFYSWPGNLTELQAVCARFVQLMESNAYEGTDARQHSLIHAIGEQTLLENLFCQFPALGAISTAPTEEVRAGVEAIKACLNYNNEKVAQVLNISRTTLWRLLNRRE